VLHLGHDYGDDDIAKRLAEVRASGHPEAEYVASSVEAFAASGAPGAIRQGVQLKVALKYAKPPVWRSVQLPLTATLGDLHAAIQVLFGWDGDHLHESHATAVCSAARGELAAPMYSTSASARWYFGESRRSGGPGVQLVVARQQERPGVALPRPDSRPGDRRGELEDPRSGRRRRPGDVDRDGVETVARALGEDDRRLVRARPDPAVLGRAVGHRRERGGQARVEARLLAGHLGGQHVVQCRLACPLSSRPLAASRG
jgi:hypothetical protein